ncbi:hypothetical protein MRX96_030863 [Rhipicephalus microplus]
MRSTCVHHHSAGARAALIRRRRTSESAAANRKTDARAVPPCSSRGRSSSQCTDRGNSGILRNSRRTAAESLHEALDAKPEYLSRLRALLEIEP